MKENNLKEQWVDLPIKTKERVIEITGWNKGFIKLVMDLKQKKNVSLADTLQFAILQAQKDTKPKKK